MQIEERVTRYWAKRASAFKQMRIDEYNDGISTLWLNAINKYLPNKAHLKILDVGTGSGYFAFLLAPLGHEVTGIDLTPEMIEAAEETASILGIKARFEVMGAQHLSYDDNTFDVVISRNLTWTLPDTDAAYKEWYRVLAPNGVLINFDCDYGKVRFANGDEETCTPGDAATGFAVLQECDEIKNSFSISKQDRPSWDVEKIKEAGFANEGVELNVSKKIYVKKDVFHNPVPMFIVYGTK